MTEHRIIDRDIMFYIADMETRHSDLCRAQGHAAEQRMMQLYESSWHVLKALIAYRDALDSAKPD